MEYNLEFKVLFEKSILSQLFSAYKFDFPCHELVDEVYSNVRVFNPGYDVVGFTYRGNSDYSGLIKYLSRKCNLTGGVCHE